MNRLTECPLCGALTVSKEGIKNGIRVWLRYAEDGNKPHKFDCPEVRAKAKEPA